jgi:hypothetical protein
MLLILLIPNMLSNLQRTILFISAASSVLRHI